MSILSNVIRVFGNVPRADNSIQFERAVKNAYARFAQVNPTWAASLFDLHFLTTRAKPILAQYAHDGSTGAVSALAGAWVSQLQPHDDLRQRRTSEVVPVAAQFLCLFESELAKASPHVWTSVRKLPCGEAWSSEPVGMI
jgi:hypothetical protein